jgi:hypothetical protein
MSSARFGFVATDPLVPPVVSSRWRSRVQIAIAFVVAGFVVATFLSTRKPDSQDQDFGAYYRAGQAAIAGTSPYVIDSHGPLGAYMYAPVFAHTFFRGLAHLPYLWAVRLFMLINWLATITCAWLCLRLMRAPGRDLLLLGLIALIPTGDYLKANLHNGQVGTMLLLACVGWMSLMLTGRSFLGGLLLSLAIGLKLYPALLVPYLLLRKDWRGIAGVCVGVLILFCIPGFFVGFGHLIPLHQQWLKFCMSTQIASQTIRTGNQSLLGVLARLPMITNGRQGLVSADNLAKLIRIYPAIVLVLTAGVYAFLYRSTRRLHTGLAASAAIALAAEAASPVRASNDRIVVRDVSLLLLWMTLASPRAWTFNFAVEILPAMLLAGAILDRRPRCWAAIIALLCVPIALGFPTNSLTFSDRWSLGAYALQNKHFDAALILAAALIWVSSLTDEPSNPPAVLAEHHQPAATA